MDKDYKRISLDDLKQLETELSSDILCQDLIEKVVNIPKNPTNKDVMCAFFGQVTLDKVMCIDPEWFNSPYGTGRKGENNAE